MTAHVAFHNSSFSDAAGQLRDTPYGEGHRVAQQALTVMAVTAEPGRRAALLAEAMADLIDMGLSWNNLHVTQERLLGFAGVLADQLRADSEPHSSLAGASQGPVLLTRLRA
ncbi:hypothetical protein [Pseudomonas lactis]|uniref:hypothetical protein n=1 Tax=Pseudomonas lactis TaxID=1615674 RepID=UPI00190B022E|nr:hypothetical protein [Pseudomonas lactis]MBK3446016.1 hypothetical protein [Pseudomonas lactis]